jgi:hypothetical protein
MDQAPEAIAELNKIIVGNSDEFIVLNQELFKNNWFDLT